MSSFALLMLLATAAIVFVFVRTLQKDGPKIVSDPTHDLNILKEQRKAEEDSFEQTLQRAEKAYEEGALHDAEAALETALRMQPENEAVLAKLAFILEQQEELKAAQSLYEKALETHKSSSRLLASYAAFMLRQGDKEEAKRLYIQAVQLEPSEPNIYYDFANLLLELGEKDAAKEGYKRALEEDRTFKPAKEALARL